MLEDTSKNAMTKPENVCFPVFSSQRVWTHHNHLWQMQQICSIDTCSNLTGRPEKVPPSLYSSP